MLLWHPLTYLFQRGTRILVYRYVYVPCLTAISLILARLHITTGTHYDTYLTQLYLIYNVLIGDRIMCNKAIEPLIRYRSYRLTRYRTKTLSCYIVHRI